MQSPSSHTTLIISANIHPLNTLQVCIWCPRFLHARHVSSVDDANDCLTGNLQSDLEACCVQDETHSLDVSHGDLRI